ncbi:MAG: T9SS type A sorting domain-containing protein [Ignavibacteriaceae bacterium]|nr:T9SS type A sorting domain-containing protein [Ignavibacteriaceae bacterium]
MKIINTNKLNHLAKVSGNKITAAYNMIKNLKDYFNLTIRPILCFSTMLILILFAAAKPVFCQTLTWDQTVQLGNLDKAGLSRLQATDYQYEVMGLAGTTLRVGPYGFTSESSPNVFSPSVLLYHPFFEYEYWWNTYSHRQQPFGIFGGYMTSNQSNAVQSNGAITAFNHHLDISTGILSINLGLTVGGTAFNSQRQEFVTPAGVWVVRICDSLAVQPFFLKISSTVDQVDNIVYLYSAKAKTNGLVVTAVSPNASTSSLAVAWDGACTVDTSNGYKITANSANDTLTFYIAPTSSYNPNSTNTGDEAWSLASLGKANGYESEKQSTSGWWKNYWAQHQVDLPASENVLARWYALSLYYHGVFFGNSHIPPGLWGTSAFPGGGAVCPEFDLPYSQLAMIYTNHVAESGNIVDWIRNTLPQAKKNALSSTLYNVTISHNWGAKYGWWVGYDGKYIIPGTVPEEINLYENYPSANCALMAAKHADFTMDPSYNAFADTVLVQTTKVETDDQALNGSTYQDANLPNNVQQDACIYGLTECVARGLADSVWTAMQPKVLMPEGIWVKSTAPYRQKVLIGSSGAVPGSGGYFGDAPLLSALWWYGIIKKNDPVIKPTFDMVSLSNTAAYVFNRGTMSVTASKIYDWNNAYKWAVSLTTPDVTHDDATISEWKLDAYDFQRTPETAAHGALICAVTQMFVDSDNNDPIEVFPAIPSSWWTSGASFTNILVKGGIAVSGNINGGNITVNLENKNSAPSKINLHVWLPSGTTSLSLSPLGTVVNNGYAALSDSISGNRGKSYNFILQPTSVNEEDNLNPANFDLMQNYPNPFNPSTQIKYSIAQSGFVSLKVYNLLGQEVAALVNQVQKTGSYAVNFDASKLASGIYFYRIQSSNFSSVKKMLLIK